MSVAKEEIDAANTLNRTLRELAVDVATVKESTENQKLSLTRIENRLDNGVFREEYERRHKDVEDIAFSARREAQEAKQESRDIRTAARTWRIAFSSAVVVLSGLIAYFHSS